MERLLFVRICNQQRVSFTCAPKNWMLKTLKKSEFAYKQSFIICTWGWHWQSTVGRTSFINMAWKKAKIKSQTHMWSHIWNCYRHQRLQKLFTSCIERLFTIYVAFSTIAVHVNCGYCRRKWMFTCCHRNAWTLWLRETKTKGRKRKKTDKVILLLFRVFW